MPALFPCPFCGENDLHLDPDRSVVICETCRATGPQPYGGLSSIYGWNTRSGHYGRLFLRGFENVFIERLLKLDLGNYPLVVEALRDTIESYRSE